jgi:parvulin-like peptidyl-prolyl isomerase
MQLILSILFLFINVITTHTLDERWQMINEVAAIIYHSEGTQYILRTDLRPGFDGQVKTLRDAIIEALMVFDAQAMHINVTKEDVDRFLAQRQREEGMSLKEVKRMFSELGMTFEEGIEQLRRMQMVQAILDFRVRGDKRIIVDRSAVEEYYKTHERTETASYTLAQVLIPYDTHTRTQIEQMIDDGTIVSKIVWEDAFEVPEDGLAEEKKFITQKEPGSIVGFEETAEGFELTRLVAVRPARVIPLDEIYEEISFEIRKAVYDKVMFEYQAKLLQNAVIRFNNPKEKEEIFGYYGLPC